MEINRTYSYTVLLLNFVTIILMNACVNLGARNMKWTEHAARMGERRNSYRRFEDFRAVSISITVFLDVTPCSLVDTKVWEEPIC
jgi:hypothetical protein